ncbi:ABC transporter ATP-binding protein [Desulfatitalea alkaliphila]|uniref:ABC transporter ATP-binding protein n=1 Tax=Desulfatitalea alkaliphila TaxID=2929485 RepID=A0AA41UI12_9BACT|nr:ABC transporter ATP-binding protein [Desulfatitalea alkaliphila]MCJ8499574.1 ABC transporter ATP-binding protein [Desulfatitalea alkaliphila]
MLTIADVNAYYDQFHVLHDVSCEVHEGEVVVMLGPNGHGKSTLLKAVCGLLDRVDGTITYKGQDITGWSTEQLVNQGVIYIAENRELFGDMTVMENLKLGAYAKNARKKEKRNLARVFELFPRLAARKKQLAATMSGGEARMLAIARGLMSNADFLCIDEPSLGLQPNLRTEVFNIIKEIHRQGKSMLLVEQNIPQIADLADRVYVLEEGCITFQGSAEEAAADDRLKEIFLGM